MGKYFALVSLALLLVSCKKPADRACFKSSGKDAVREIPLEDFSSLKLGQHLAYVIIQDSLDKVVIKGGENLVDLVVAEVESARLTISNRNRCSFLRDEHKEIVVEIHCTKLTNIHYEGSEYLHTQGTIVTDYFTLSVRDGAGPVVMDIKAIIIDADISHGWGDYTLRGEADYARISARSNGYCDTYGLTIRDSIYVASETPGTVKVKADQIPLRGYMKGSGDVWYIGTPTLIDVVQTGSGLVLNKN